MRMLTTKREPFARGFLACASDCREKKAAAGLLAAAREMSLLFDRDTGLVEAPMDGATGIRYQRSVFCDERQILREAAEHPEDAEDLLAIAEEMRPFVRHRHPEDFFTEEERAHLEEHDLWGGTWMGHAVPEFSLICSLGTDGLRERVEDAARNNPAGAEFYDAMRLTLEAVDVLGRRAGEEAGRLLREERDPETAERWRRISDTMEHAPQKPCRDFAEAVIVFTLVFSLDGVDSPGHFDQYMYPFWERTEEDLRRRYLRAIWRYFHKVRAWNLCISGSDENGRDLTNGLSEAILETTADYRFQTPNLTMRVHAGTPESLWRLAYRSVASGCGMPAIYSDDTVCPALESLGIPPADAHRYVMNGCNQIDIQGCSHMGLEDGEVLFAKAVEYALFDGTAPKTGRALGLRTGDPCSFSSFDDFLAAVLAQLDHMTDTAAAMANKARTLNAAEAPNPLRSLLIGDCLARGKDYKDGGPRYVHGQILAEGIADAADSLAAVKRYVFDEGRITMRELTDALRADFEGFGEIHALLKGSPEKFGNDRPLPDGLAALLTEHFNRHLREIPTAQGGMFSGGCSPFDRAAGNGLSLGAMPNGKRRDESLLADSVGATPGFDRNGPTALLNSCLRHRQELAGSGFILNLKFDRSLFTSETGYGMFRAVCRTYFRGGGQMLTFTVVSRDELLDAQVHPEDHRDLIVRVGGYSDYFVNLIRPLQDNVIARTELG